MRIKESTIRQIIKEELNREAIRRILSETQEGAAFPPDARKKSKSWKAKFIDGSGKVVRSLDISIVFEMLYTEMLIHIEDVPGATITLVSSDGKMGPYVLRTTEDLENFVNQPSGQ